MRTVDISGVWIRTTDDSLQVLIEVEGRWRRVWQEPLVVICDSLVSHIIQPLGVYGAPEEQP